MEGGGLRLPDLSMVGDIEPGLKVGDRTVGESETAKRTWRGPPLEGIVARAR